MLLLTMILCMTQTAAAQQFLSNFLVCFIVQFSPCVFQVWCALSFPYFLFSVKTGGLEFSATIYCCVLLKERNHKLDAGRKQSRFFGLADQPEVRHSILDARSLGTRTNHFSSRVRSNGFLLGSDLGRDFSVSSIHFLRLM